MSRDVNLRPGALRQFAKTGSEIGVRMAVENGDDAQALAFRFRDIIIHIAFRIDHRGLTVGAEKIGSVRESFDKETFQIHGVNLVEIAVAEARCGNALKDAAPAQLRQAPM